ncbi:MAG: ferredoxin [Candidatus Brocadiia bacterium]
MKAKVDEDLCAGVGECEAACPQVFKVVDGLSKVQVETVPAEAEEACREAAERCPMAAISVEA